MTDTDTRDVVALADYHQGWESCRVHHDHMRLSKRHLRRLLPDANEPVADDTAERLHRALQVAGHKVHDEQGEPNEGFPTCSGCGAILTEPDEFSRAVRDVLGYGAAPPEYPGLALVPQPSIERLRRAVDSLRATPHD